MDRIYADFTTRAAAGRKMPVEKLRELARGRVWTGEDALANGLVDALGGYGKALALAKEAAKLPADARVNVEEYPRRKGTSAVLSELLGQTGDNSEDDAANVSLATPWAPLMQGTRMVYSLGARLGLLDVPRHARLAPRQRAHALGQRAVVRDLAEQIDGRELRLEVVAVALHEAPGDDDAADLAALLAPHEVLDRALGLRSSRPDERAGVHDQHVRELRFGGERHARFREVAHHDFGVDEVLRATKGNETDGGGHGKRQKT